MKALLIDKPEGAEKQTVELTDVDEERLPAGDVTVRVAYSTLNYKDGLAITGRMPIAKSYPMVPGIDFAGTVETSEHPDFKAGDQVILNGWGVGEKHWGGLAEKARVKGDWLVPLPKAFSPKQAMAIGTAGYTAMLCVLALERHGVTPKDGEIIVTGATGGVGSVAVSVLSKLGYTVVASTGKTSESSYLETLGASSTIDREELSKPGRPLGSERWAGAVDTVGSNTLANICATTKYGGVVTACGLAGGFDFKATVMPFILRGVTLAGIDSVYCPKPHRIEAWRRLAEDLDPAHVEMMMREIRLDQAIEAAGELIAGAIRGRVVVEIGG